MNAVVLFILLLAFVNRNKKFSMHTVTNRLMGSHILKAHYLLSPQMNMECVFLSQNFAVSV